MAAAKVVHSFEHLWVHSQLTCSYNTVCLVKKANQLRYLLRRLERARLGSFILTSIYRCGTEAAPSPFAVRCSSCSR